MYPQPQQHFIQSKQRSFKKSRSDTVEEDIRSLFNKKFRFNYNPEWNLPPIECWFSTPPWKVKELQSLKTRLNFQKSQLNDFDIEEWSSHTRRRSPAGEVCWRLKYQINPEFLTQAWTKFYECVCNYRIMPKEAIIGKKMVSLHLCEAPGAFITSLNHYLKSHYDEIEWKWVASTLNPYYEGNSPSYMISDDRFIYHTLDNWHFGVDNTGNLMDWSNSQAIVQKARSLGEVLLVTCDGSIDCLQKPDAQEEITSPLHYCEIITAIQALSKGGTLIIKLFTVFEHCTVSLMYLLNQLFSEVNIYKPITSRQGNSEVYAVCLRYIGCSKLPNFIPVLKSAYGTEVYNCKSLFPLEKIPESFLKQIEECSQYFCSLQCQVISLNLEAYLMQNNIALHNEIKRIRAIVATEYIHQYDLKPLKDDQKILNPVLYDDKKINTNPRYTRGSYTERQRYSKLNAKGKWRSLHTFLQDDVIKNEGIFIHEFVKWIDFYDNQEDLKISFTYGCPLEKINSSKFIFVPLFKLYQQILNEEEFQFIIMPYKCIAKNSTEEDIIEEAKELVLPEFEYKCNYDDYEKHCFQMLLIALRDMKEGESLLLYNFNTLTHFNVSLLYVISRKCFEKTGFTRTYIILSNLKNKEGFKYLDLIENECKVMRDKSKTVLNSLPVQVTNAVEYFSNVYFYNNTYYMKKCTQYLFRIEQALST